MVESFGKGLSSTSIIMNSNSFYFILSLDLWSQPNKHQYIFQKSTRTPSTPNKNFPFSPHMKSIILYISTYTIASVIAPEFEQNLENSIFQTTCITLSNQFHPLSPSFISALFAPRPSPHHHKILYIKKGYM